MLKLEIRWTITRITLRVMHELTEWNVDTTEYTLYYEWVLFPWLWSKADKPASGINPSVAVHLTACPIQPLATSSGSETRHERTTSPEPHPISSSIFPSSFIHPVIFISIPSVLAFPLIHSLCFLSSPCSHTLTAYVTFPACPVGCRVLLPSSHPLSHLLYLSSIISRGDHLASTTPVVAGSSWLHSSCSVIIDCYYF